ncbi:hypothetical protein D3C85_841590 [compost metagenome]
MLQLYPEHIEQIRAQALETYPEEAAWLITTSGCRRVINIAEDPENFFDVSVRDVQRAMAEGLLAVVHSHTNGKHYPSQADMQQQIATAVPWGIVLCDGVVSSRVRWWGGRTADQLEPLDGRTFCHGTSDCYAAVRDHYLISLGIALPEFPREWMWWKGSDDLLRQGFGEAGFSVVTTPRPHDVWLASFHSDKINHCGVLLENGLTYHQPGGGEPIDASKKASRQPMFRYLSHVALWVRHKDLA